MATDVHDAALKARQAGNFDDLNGVVAGSPFDRHTRFFNFGYRPLSGEVPVGPALGPAFPNRDSAQLLFQLVGDVDLAGRDITEIGCGRGGNLWLLRRSFEPGRLVGLDIAFLSIAHCRASAGADEHHVVADAERVPLADRSTDVVLSVETSCTYPRIEGFFREVARVLRHGGGLLYTDLIRADLVPAFIDVLSELGLELIHRRDITANVAASRDARAERQRLAFGSRPDVDDATMGEFVGQDGSRLHTFLNDGEHRYVILRFRKDRQVEPPAADLLSQPHQDLVRSEARLAAELLTIPSRSTGS